jgi:hypothetical protein
MMIPFFFLWKFDTNSILRSVALHLIGVFFDAVFGFVENKVLSESMQVSWPDSSWHRHHFKSYDVIMHILLLHVLSRSRDGGHDH